MFIDQNESFATQDQPETKVGAARVLFSIRDLLVLTTATAVIVVIAPSMKYLVEGISINAWIISFWIMLVCVMLIARYRGSVRKNVLSQAGTLLARGTVRDLEWQQRLHTVVWLQLIFGLLLMVSMSIWVGLSFGIQWSNITFATPMYIPVVLALQMAIMAILFLSSAVFSLIWKTYPGEVEFYEKGVSVNGHRFHTWDQIDQLVPSEGYKSAIALTLRYFSLFRKKKGQPYTMVIRMRNDEIQPVLDLYQTMRVSGNTP